MTENSSNIFISVVIPAYNAAGTIKSCVDSILRQNSDIIFEIVIVNDGSNDNTATILDEYADRHAQIKVVHQQNGGVTSARKKGLECCSGQWITFVDADDNLPSDAFAKYAYAYKKDYDIIVGEFLEKHHSYILEPEKYREEVIKCTVNPSPCAKLFRRALFDDNVFDIPREIKYGEDLLMNIRLAFKTDKPVYMLGEVVYKVNRYATSASHTFVKTAEYEEQYSQLVLSSIPELFRTNKRFLYSALSLKINGWKTLNFSNWSTKRNRNTEFYRHLIQQITASGYALSWKDRIQVYGSSLPMRIIAIWLNLYPVLKYKVKCLKKE